jgi:hypothetical protein
MNAATTFLALLAGCTRYEAAHDAAPAPIDARSIDASPPKDAAVADAKRAAPKSKIDGKGFSCSLFDDGSVTCAGDIGFGAQAKTLQPAAVPGVTKAERLFVIGRAACAAITNEELVCWGDIDARGRITHAGNHRLPTPLRGVDHVVALAERAALRDDGDVVYWVDGAPKRAHITDATEIASTADTACALREGGKVSCVSLHPLCPSKPTKLAPAVRKPVKSKPGKSPAPTPQPELKSPLEDAHLPKSSHLAFDLGGICAQTAAETFECLDVGDGCKSHRIPGKR